MTFIETVFLSATGTKTLVKGRRMPKFHLTFFFFFPGVNFINMFTQSFYTHRSQKRKLTNDWTVFFLLLGYAHVKTVGKTLVKSTPGEKLDSLRFTKCPPPPMHSKFMESN